MVRLPQTLTGVCSLAHLIAFKDFNLALEAPPDFKDNTILIECQGATACDATFFAVLAADRAVGGSRGVDVAIKRFNLDALVLPAPGLTSAPAAVAGHSIVTVPLGFYPDNMTIQSAGPETFIRLL